LNGYNFTDRVRKVLQMAREEAARLRHEYVGPQHILLAIVEEGEGVASAVLTNLGVDLEELERRVEAAVKPGTDGITGPDVPYTSRAKKVLEFAMSEARELNHSYVGTEHLLLGLIREEKGVAAHVLKELGVGLDTARAETARLVGSTPTPLLNYGRHHFTAVIALIELHRTRTGAYPDSLDDLQFLDAQDRDSLQWVGYEKLADGYALDIGVGSGTAAKLKFPAEFWRGLGIRRSNVKRDDA
jgi:ClpA/ClpB-like protein